MILLWSLWTILTKDFAQTLLTLIHSAFISSFILVIMHESVWTRSPYHAWIFIFVYKLVSSSSYHGWMYMKVIRRLVSRGLLLSVYTCTQLYYWTTPFCNNFHSDFVFNSFWFWKPLFLAVQNSSIGLIVPWLVGLSGTTNNQSLHNTTEWT